MSKYQTVTEGKDPELWQIACKRARFIRHAIAYVIINTFLWALWYFTGNHNDTANGILYYPWPIWTTLCWGVGLVASFASAYLFTRINFTEREYQKLLNKK